MRPEKLPIERACYWLARSPSSREPPLEGPRDADVVIVGAGLTGLWTALHLASLKPGLGVTIVEEMAAASGASGRNAGMLSEGIDHTHALAAAHFGFEEARLMVGLGRENLAEMELFLTEHHVDCDLEKTGQLQVALCPAHMEILEATFRSCQELGVTDYELLDRDFVRGEIHSERYLGALFNPNAALLDPVKLTLGLKRLAQAAGVRLFEGTRVTALEKDGASIRVSAASGHVRARRAVLATNAYTRGIFPGASARFIPLYDYILVSEPLTPSERQAIGWRQRQGVTDARNFFNYYRLTPDGRILWGTSEAQYTRGGRVEATLDHSPRVYAALKESFLSHFKALEGLEFPFRWGGPIAATTRFTPFFGRALDGRLLYGLGYTGHGLATTHLGGKILAHMALDLKTPLEELSLVSKPPFPYPPEPLRSWAVASVSRALRRVDAGGRKGLLLKCLDALGIGLSS